MGADRHFRRFVATGEPEALGRVFDAVAPKLLLAATHLARKGAEAEDLVQATFLRAIEGAKTFDSGRRLMPWLVGILTNEARMAGRRNRREADPERLPVQPPPALDPQDAAAAKELDDALARALEALPKRYRSVLTFKLVHGLSPLEIAHALELPPETVKSRIRRGLQMLRRALPVSHAVGLAAVALPSSGLAAARAAVLGHVPSIPTAAAPTAAAPAAGELLLGGTLMKKVTIAGLCVLFAGTAGFGLWASFEEPGLGGGAEETSANPMAPVEGRQALPRGLDREPLAPSSNVDLPAWRLVGMVRDPEERPVPGARIELKAEGSGVEGSVAGTSVARGRYVVDLSPWQERSRFENAHVTLKALVWAPGFHVGSASIPLGNAVKNSADSSELVLAQDFILQKGNVLTGHVVDADGKPVPEAFVSLHVGGSKSEARTNARGRYQVNVRQGGVGYLLARGGNMGAGILRDLPVEAGQDQILPDLTLSSLGVIRGVLLYDDRQPIAGYEVWAQVVSVAPQPQEPSDPRHVLGGTNGGSCLSSDDGRFVIRGLKPGRYKITPSVLLSAESNEEPTYEVETDQAPIEIRLAYHGLDIRVLDPEGKPVLHTSRCYFGWKPEKDPLVRRLAAGEPVFGELWNSDVIGSGQFRGQLVPKGSWWLIKTGALDHGAHRLVCADGPNHETLVDLRLAKPPPRDARLRVSVLSPEDRKPMPFEIELMDTLPGFGAGQEEIESSKGVKVYRCCPGTFLAGIQPAPTGVFQSPSTYMKIRRLVKLESHQEAQLTVVAEQGGRVALFVHTPSGWKGSKRRVRVTVPGGLGEPPRGLHPYQYEQVLGKGKSYVRFGAGPVNQRVICKGLLSPGKHILTVETKGFKPKQVAVEIFAGKVTDAQVWLTEDDIQTGKSR